MFEIFDRDGNVKAIASNVDYDGSFCGSRVLTAEVKSPVPIDFKIGDYIIFRNETFTLNYDTDKEKSASKYSHGEAFRYTLNLHPYSEELAFCDFLDVVPADNNKHFSALPTFSFYCETIRDLAARLKANLDRLYTGEKEWTVNVADDVTIVPQSLSFSNQKCIKVLEEAHKTLKVTYTITGRTITFGGEAVTIHKVFAYGKGKGFRSIESSVNDNEAIITRLRAYGSTANLPSRYYNKVYAHQFTGERRFFEKYTLGEHWIRYEDDSTNDRQDERFRVNTESGAVIFFNSAEEAEESGLPYLYGATQNIYVNPDTGEIQYNSIMPPSTGWTNIEEYTSDLSIIFGHPYTGEVCIYPYGKYAEKATPSVDTALSPQNVYHWQSAGNTNFRVDRATGKVLFFNSRELLNPDELDEVITDGGEESGLPHIGEVGDGIYVNTESGEVRFFNGGTNAKNWYRYGSIPGKIVGRPYRQEVTIAKFQEYAWYYPWKQFIKENMYLPNLMLPNLTESATDMYIDDTEGIAQYGIREASVFFDGTNDNEEIKPTLKGLTAQDLTEAGYNITLPEGDSGKLDAVAQGAPMTGDNGTLDENGELPKERATFVIVIKNIGFDINDVLLPGEKAKIAFSSGACAGREFEISKCELMTPTGLNPYWENHHCYILTCLRVIDSDIQLAFPYESFPVSNGDEFTLVGIKLPDVYIQAAEQKLLRKATEWLASNSRPAPTIQPEIDNIYLKRNPDIAKQLIEGKRIIIDDEDLGITITSTISNLKIRCDSDDIPQYEITLSEDSTETFAERVTREAAESTLQNKTSTANIKALVEAFGADRFLSKVKQDTAQQSIKFLKGFTAGNYSQHNSGASVDGQGNAEVGSLEARGYAKIGGDAEVAGAVRAGRDIESDGTVKASEGMQSPDFRTPDFNANALMGTGAGVYSLNGLTYGEVDYLTVRRGMTVAELLIQQYRAIGGAFVVSCANGEIDRIYETTDTDGAELYQLILKDAENAPHFVAGDLIRCAHFDTSLNVYRTYWVEVHSVDYEGSECVYVAKSQFPDGVTPLESDTIVQMGNTTDTARQSCIVITVEKGRPQIAMYDGIDSPLITSGNWRAIYGCLEGLTDPESGEEMKGYGLWSSNVYLTGSLKLRSSGKTIENALLDSLSNRRNYARGTRKAFTVTSPEGGVNETYPMYDVYGLRTGDKVTVSFDWEYSKVANGADGEAVIAVQFGKPYGYVTAGLRITDAGTQGTASGHVSHTFTVPKVYGTETDATTVDNGAVMMRLDHTLTDSDGYIRVSNFIVTAGDREAEWVEAPEDAFTDAANAQADADAAKERLDRWADDGVVSPAEKRELKDEVARIGSDYDEITGKHADNGVRIESDIVALDEAYDEYDAAYLAYRGMLEAIITDTREDVPVDAYGDFDTLQNNYYSTRATILHLLTTAYQSTVSHLFEVTDGKLESVQKRTDTLANAGRNLLLQTNEGVTGWKVSNGVADGFLVGTKEYRGNEAVLFTRNGSVSSWEVFLFQLRPEMIEQGKQYALSFDAYCQEGDGIPLTATICNASGGDPLVQTDLTSESLRADEWVHMTYLFTATASGDKDGSQEIYISVPVAHVNLISELAIANIKLEEGDIPTAWGKAPEDLVLGLDGMATVLKTDYESRITQTAEEIRSEVSETVTELDGRITENSSAIKQTADEITLKVSESTSPGRNYAYGTAEDVVETDFDATGTNNTIRLYDITGLKTGDTITVSFDIELPQIITVDGLRIIAQLSGEFGYANAGTVIPDLAGVMIPAGTQHVTATLTLAKNSDGADIVESDTGYIYLRLDNLGTVSLKVSRLKVEKGNTETEWTPLTGDVVTALKETGIDIALDRIRLKAPKTEVVAYDDAGNEYPVAMFGTKEVTEDGTAKTVPVIDTALIDADGLVSRRLIAVDSNGQVVSTVNVMTEDGRYYTHYPVTYDSEGNVDADTVKTTADGYNIGYPASCFGYDPETDYIFRAWLPSGKSQWGFRIGDEQGNQAGFVMGFDKWRALGLCKVSDSTDVGEDTADYTVPLVFPDDVTLTKNDNGTYSASPVYGTAGTGVALPAKYKEFMPGSQSAYLSGANHVKEMTAGELADTGNLGEDYDFTSGITGKYVKTVYPVQGKVTVIDNELLKQASVGYTWAIHVYEDGSLIDTIYKVKTFILDL